jgi:aryl-alcohol dehydrogenase-like predicted oxidoreductase
MAREKGVSNSALAIAWMVNLYRCDGFPRVIPLFASSRVSHFMDNLKGTTLTLSDEEMAILNRA